MAEVDNVVDGVPAADEEEVAVVVEVVKDAAEGRVEKFRSERSTREGMGRMRWIASIGGRRCW